MQNSQCSQIIPFNGTYSYSRLHNNVFFLQCYRILYCYWGFFNYCIKKKVYFLFKELKFFKRKICRKAEIYTEQITVD